MLYETEKKIRKVKTFVGISKQFKKNQTYPLISYFAMLNHIFVRLKTAKTIVCKTPSFSKRLYL